ncbi:MAG TPA: type IX secretion system sortase PorU [Bacteroidia bacterium]|nr:type IX secretion system sortase PorU [Bacteroidia bacterium]
MKRSIFSTGFILFVVFSGSVTGQLKQKPAVNTVKNSNTVVKNSEPVIKPVQTSNNGLITLQWQPPHNESVSENGPTKVFIGFKGATYNGGLYYLPEYVSRIKLNASTNHVLISLVNEIYEPLTSAEAGAIENEKAINTDVQLNYSIVHEYMFPYVQITLLPIRKNQVTGKYEKLVSFKFSMQQNTEISQKKPLHQATFATSSVLGSGRWYKIGVTADGVYKLDYNFLKNLGYNMSSLVPSDIRIYGNGGPMLPLKNDAYRPDDLQENPIFVQGQNDSSFGKSDYILFYGTGPHVWAYDNTDKRYHHTVNLYTDTTFYFITADLGKGKRIVSEKDSGYAITDTVTSFDDYAYNELDQTNLIQSGNQWFGQYFDVTTSYNIPFNFPNIVTSSPVYVNTALASRYDLSFGLYSYYKVTCGNGSANIACPTCSTTCYYCTYAAMGTGNFTFNPSASSFTVNVNKVTSGAIGWLYYVETNVRRPLTMPTDQMEFRDAASVGAGKFSLFNISTYSPLQVWDVTNPYNVSLLNLKKTTSGSSQLYQFTLPTDTLRQFMAFTGNTYLTPTAFGLVPNQNLHSLPQTDLVIVTNPSFYPQAMQLAAFHRAHDSLKVEVATTTQVYNEFSSGQQDPVAIRDFCRMFYTRESTQYNTQLKYLLLYGDGSYDPKNRMPGNSNFIVAFESPNSFDPTNSYVSDDFYAVLDTAFGNLDTNQYTYNVNIGVGRLTVDNVSEAQTVLNKIESYETGSGEPVVPSTSCCNPQSQYNLGNWRNTVCFIAHDGDADAHVGEAEGLADTVVRRYPNLNVNKIYLDAYQMEQTPGGPRYPDVNTAIDNQMDQGLLVINFTGHGGVFGLAVSRVLTFSDIYSWNNINKLSLFFTASCEFARYDDPEQISAGELCLQSSTGGNIALMTTVRDVYSGGNTELNTNFYDNLYSTLPDGSLPRLGDLYRKAKNETGLFVNTLNFALLGDPAVRLAYPKYRVYTSDINSKPLTSVPDTLKALAKVTVSGYIGDTSKNMLGGFNGVLYPTIYDKPVYEYTLDNLGGTNSPVIQFKLQKNELFNGRVSVTNGKFSFSFVVPKDIQYNFGFGKISYYAQNGTLDATGSYDSIVVGGSSPTAYNNGKGPKVRLYVNDSNFAYGGMTNENPELFAILNDSNGINTAGSSIGHDITAVLDNNAQNTIDLNQYYQPALNNYQKGTVTYPFSSLTPGTHSLSLRVWNVYNNTTEASTEFVVQPQSNLQLQHVLNYPNPFTTHTQFFFELNEVCDQTNVQIQIFTITGKLVKNIVTTVKTDSFRSQPIDWDGRDDYGDRIGNGVYIYHVKVRTSEGTTTDSYQKLVIL